jgi:hypothetical protein
MLADRYLRARLPIVGITPMGIQPPQSDTCGLGRKADGTRSVPATFLAIADNPKPGDSYVF